MVRACSFSDSFCLLALSYLSLCDIGALKLRLNVFAHFTGGISLSPSFVVMYVMQYYNLSWEDALHLVQNRRYCISPNGGFMTQIKVSPEPVARSRLTRVPQEYESIYKAKAAIASHPQQRVFSVRRKRSEEDDEDNIQRYYMLVYGASETTVLTGTSLV